MAEGGPKIDCHVASYDDRCTRDDLDSRIKTLRRHLSHQIERCVSEAIGEFMHLPGATGLSGSAIPAANGRLKVGRKGGSLTDKVFLHRRSLFSELFDVSHFRTVQHLFMATIIVYVLNTAVGDAVACGNDWKCALPELEFVQWAFGRFSVVAGTWIWLMAATLVVFPGVIAWWHLRRQYSSVTVDVMGYVMWICYEIAFLVIPCWIIIVNGDLPVASAVAFACEQVRLLMKMHAFIREATLRMRNAPCRLKTEDESPNTLNEHIVSNAFPRVKENCGALTKRRSSKQKSGDCDGTMHGSATQDRSRQQSLSSEGSTATSGSLDVSLADAVAPFEFGRYLYFLFAPTLVYRDEYPKTGMVRWSAVVANFLQVVLCVLYAYYVVVRYLLPELRILTGDEPVSLSIFLLCWGRCAMPGILLYVLGHYALLHSWMNAFAEMLKFGDREFYRDWWNAVSFATYYRDWNRVVHDFLYQYVYLDFMRSGIRNRALAALSVFGLSSLFHQYIMICALRFYLPFFEFSMLITGLLSVFVVAPRHHNSIASRTCNVALWVAMILGNGLLLCGYAVEWSARQHFPPPPGRGPISDILLPRFLYYSTNGFAPGHD